MKAGTNAGDMSNPSSNATSRLNMELEFNLKDGEDDDEDSYDEQQELASLVAASAQNRRRQTQSPAQASLQARARNDSSLLKRIFGTRKSLRLILAIAAVFGLFYLLALPSKKKSAVRTKGNIHYKCPQRVKPNANGLDSDGKLEVDKDLDVWLNTFRAREYDRWGHTYNDVKASMKPWISTMFAPYLGTNSTIYDASSGVGLDALMTLETLKEANGLSGLTVYGNDLNNENVEITNSMFEKLTSDVGGRIGIFCRADSTALNEFVPPDSFDLVYSGRIPPLANPLGLKGKLADLDREHNSLCSLKLGNDEKKKLDLFNTRQEEWYLKWTMEMLRIAKPGSPVIIQHISLPLCQNVFDFGGVSMSFWNSTPSIASLVKPNSLKIQKDKLVKERYHVFLRKKKLELGR